MLEPNSRQLMMDALQPPSGYRLDWAVGTTYTLDLTALLTAPVAFAFSDWQDRDGRPASDPLALLKAVRQYADRICLFCQAGKIHVPRAYQPLLSDLEGSVYEATAPNGGKFHPKVWFLRFVATDNESPVMYRLLCMTRNMTFDRSWDTLLSLEGFLLDRKNEISVNKPLGVFVKALPTMSCRSLSPEWAKRMKQLACDICRVDFKPPDPFDQIQFLPFGVAATDPWPFPTRIQRLLVISPFVDDKLLNDLTEWKAPMWLVSRPESLRRLAPATLDLCQKVWILDDTAEPEPGENEDESGADASGSSGDQADVEELPLVGLHAKVYVADDGHWASVFTGSANATQPGFYDNVEFMVELRGMKSKCGVEAILGNPDAAKTKQVTKLSDLLQPYSRGEAAEPVDQELELFERQVERLAGGIASLCPQAVVAAAETPDLYSMTLQFTKKKPRLKVSECHIRIRPISHAAQLFDVDLSANPWARIPSVPLLGLTSFFVFEVQSADLKHTRHFVLNIPLSGVPENRREALLRHLLSDQGRVMRFLLMLLTDAGPRDLPQIMGSLSQQSQHHGTDASPFGSTLFESLVQTLHRNPERLDQMAQLIEELKQTSEGQSLLPEGLDAIWEPIWAVREQRETKPTKSHRRATGKRQGKQ